jgi:AcrR family transcriptional regulator
MSPVKPPPGDSGDGPRRRDRAETRARMLDAAKRLFLARGYAGTTIPDIAAAAEVAVPTIYWAFGSKRAMVGEIRAAWLETARTGERLREVLAIDEPGARLDAYAAFMANQWASGADALAIQQDAMRADPEVAAEITAVLAERAERLGAVVAPLAPCLREPLSVETAHDLLLALSLLEVYRELHARGWTDAQYQAWLGQALREQLLDTGDADAPRPRVHFRD